MVTGRLYLQAPVCEAIVISDIAMNVWECSNKIGQQGLNTLLRSLLHIAARNLISLKSFHRLPVYIG